ncbi:metallophosphoesterase [Aeribacillus alveayuensis]|uniref:MPP superfamily phosphohydrolase n=1 Tax=Aeribacillus alveayuensis TaxID=279215 RepID=A0ABT9VMM0_9BACI|nr:putative MPP superfamily phosphohydrolase [Bacillus alveayuensis]
MKGISRRHFLKGFLGILLTSIGGTVGGYSYAKYIEPRRLAISKQTVEHEQIPASFHEVTIVQFSDTHLSDFFTIEQFKNVIDTINSLKPHMIVFTGDLIDEPNRYSHINEIIPLLKKLNAPLGKFAIYGNHDHGGYGTNIYRNILELSNFHLLRNETKKITLMDGSYIYIAGIDDLMLGRPNWNGTLQNMEENAFSILLVHEPDAVNRTQQFSINLQLSGHSHGGQIKLPFIGALYTPPYAEQYYEGLYQVGKTTLYVNRGLGTTRVPYRFLSVPEITLFTLKSK